MSKQIVCMGSVNMDLCMYMQSMPSVGETVRTDNFATYPGGKAGNQAAAAGELGGNVCVLARLGDDAFSTQLTQELALHGVDSRYLIYEKGATAGIAMIRIDAQGRNSISFTSGANAAISPADVQNNADAFTEGGILLITLELPMETVRAAMTLAKKRHMQVVLDPSPVPAGGLPEDLCAMVDYAKPNEVEAELLSGIPVTDFVSAAEACDRLMSTGIAHPIISMSDKGAFTRLDGRNVQIEPIKVNSIDSTAAGDVFLGAFAVALSKGQPAAQCLAFANTAAALSTTKKGAQSSIPAPQEVAAALSRGE